MRLATRERTGVNPVLWEFVQAIEHGPDCHGDLRGKFTHLACEFPDATSAALYQFAEIRYGIDHPITVEVAIEIANRIRTDAEAPPQPTVDPRTDAFLQSFEWRRVRFQVLSERGYRCHYCGRTPKDNITINVDHWKNRKRYPELALTKSNLRVSCSECNHGKGNMDVEDPRSQHDHSV